jgi:hypothetical protein
MSGRGEKDVEICQTTGQAEPGVSLIHSLHVLVRFSNSEMLSWPSSSPLLVLLEFIDPNVLFGTELSRCTLLHHLVDLVDPFDYSMHAHQLILAKQLVECGANVTAVSSPHGVTPLHTACYSGNVTNLDLVEYLLEVGADPNAQDPTGLTPLMRTMPDTPGAAKFLLNWPTTDANTTTRSGESFPVRVRSTVKYFSIQIALPDNSEKIQHQFLLQQWREIEEMLVE